MMDYVGKVEIHHVEQCKCRIDGSAIYVVAPCYTMGRQLTKRRLAQMLHFLRRKGKVSDPL